jgi:hypothetical protein
MYCCPYAYIDGVACTFKHVIRDHSVDFVSNFLVENAIRDVRRQVHQFIIDGGQLLKFSEGNLFWNVQV